MGGRGVLRGRQATGVYYRSSAARSLVQQPVLPVRPPPPHYLNRHLCDHLLSVVSLFVRAAASGEKEGAGSSEGSVGGHRLTAC